MGVPISDYHYTFPAGVTAADYAAAIDQTSFPKNGGHFDRSDADGTLHGRFTPHPESGTIDFSNMTADINDPMKAAACQAVPSLANGPVHQTMKSTLDNALNKAKQKREEAEKQKKKVTCATCGGASKTA
jgi:hypothetical protein